MADRLSAAVVSLSSRLDYHNDSTAAAEELLHEAGFDVVERVAAPREHLEIKAILEQLDEQGMNLVVTIADAGSFLEVQTAAKAASDHELPGLARLVERAGKTAGLQWVDDLGLVGVRGRTLMLSVPGDSPGAARAFLDLAVPTMRDLAGLLLTRT